MLQEVENINSKTILENIYIAQCGVVCNNVVASDAIGRKKARFRFHFHYGITDQSDAFNLPD